MNTKTRCISLFLEIFRSNLFSEVMQTAQNPLITDMSQPLDASEIPQLLIFRHGFKKGGRSKARTLCLCQTCKTILSLFNLFNYLFNLASTTVDLEPQLGKVASFGYKSLI